MQNLKITRVEIGLIFFAVAMFSLAIISPDAGRFINITLAALLLAALVGPQLRTIKEIGATISAGAKVPDGRYKTFILQMAIVAAFLVVTVLTLTVLSPAAGEMMQNALLSVGWLINLALASLVVILIPAFFAWNFKKGIHVVVDFSGMNVRALASGWMPPECRPDVLICNLPNESPDAFKARLAAGIEKADAATWVVVIVQGYPVGMIYSAAGVIDFVRDAPPFQSEAWLPEQKIVPADTRFIGETEKEYHDYIESFFLHFPEWAQRSKITKETSGKSFVFQQVLRAALVSCFVLFSSVLFAQKSLQVRDALGTKIREIPAAGTRITYLFANSEIYRIADGKSDFVSLLVSAPMYRDNGGGNFVALMSGQKIVCRASSTGNVAAVGSPITDPTKRAEIMRPRDAVEVVPEGGGFSLPDSATSAAYAEIAKDKIRQMDQRIGQISRPWWEVIMFLFWEWMPLLIIICGAAYLAAYGAAKEGYWFAHRYAKGFLMGITLVAFVVILVDALLWAKYSGCGTFWLIIYTIIATAFGSWLFTRVNPDYRPAAGNQQRGISRRGGNDNYPPLNSGQ